MAVVDRTPAWAIVGGVVLAIMSSTLFWGGTVGVAGDSSDVACHLGLERVVAAGAVGGDHVVVELRPVEGSVPDCPGQDVGPSHSIHMRTAMAVTRMTGLGPGLDLRVLGVLSLALASTAVMAIVAAIRGPRWLQVITGTGLALVIADGGVGPSFVSLHSGATAVLALLLLAAAWVWHPTHRALRAAPGLVLLGAGAGLVSSSWPMALLAPPLAIAVAVRGTPGGTPRRRVAARMGYGVVAVGIVIAGWSTWRTVPDPPSATPRADAGEAVAEVAHHAVTMPADAFALHRQLAEATATVRDAAYGNFPADAAEAAGATTCRLCVVSNLAPFSASAAWLLLPAFWLVAVRLGVVLVARARRAGEPIMRATGELLVLLAVVAAANHTSVALTSGSVDAVRHELLSAVATALIVPLLVPSGWALHTLGVRLGTAPGLLRGLGRWAAVKLVLPPEPSGGEPTTGAHRVTRTAQPAPRPLVAARTERG